MALSDYYVTLTHKRRTATDPLGVGDSLATLGTFQGYIQRRSGNEAVVQNEYGESSTYILYTYTANDVLFGDVIVKGGAVYSVTEPGEDDGVVSLGKHKEIGLRRVVSSNG